MLRLLALSLHKSLKERLDDEALEVQVRLAFALDRKLKHAGIDVESWKKEVRLSGSVQSAQAKQAALQKARDVTGVSSVSDRLTVEQGAAAERAIRANPNLRDAAISVRLNEGEIVLEGRVESGAESDLAALLARAAAGQAVRNALRIRR